MLETNNKFISLKIHYDDQEQVDAFKKSDFFISVIAGESIALLSIPVLKNIGLFEIVSAYNHGMLFFIIIWLFVLPCVAAISLYVAYYLSNLWKPTVFQIGKYGLIGFLNLFLSAGILNLFIWITDIAIGWLVTVFTAIAFAITITHSFFWNKFWIFQAHYTNNGKNEYVKFFIITSIVSLLNLLLFHIMVNIIGAPSSIDEKIWANIALFALIPVAFLGNFFGSKILVFRK